MDIDENSLGATDSEHQLLKAGASPSAHDQMETLKSQLTNGSFGMEDEGSENSNESPLKLKEEAVGDKDPIQNGEEENSESTSDKKEDPESKNQLLDLQCDQPNGSFEDFAADQLSPSLRRSTRASALKAQEKIRLKDGAPASTTAMVDSHVAENGPVAATPASELSAQTTAADSDQQMELPIKKKRKLSENEPLDQFDCKFGIRLDADGDVVMMTDGSEISSLNEEEATALHQKYKELTTREDAEATFEKKKEQEFQIRELESSLRQEEAKLAMLKKIRANQQLTARNAMQENARRLNSNISQNSSGTAYKPPIAQQNTNKLNGTSSNANSKTQRNRTTRPNTSPAGNFQLTPQHQQILQKLLEQGAIRPEQLATILHSLNPATLTALSQASTKTQQTQGQKEQEQKLREQREKEQKLRLEQEAQRKVANEAAEAARMARENAQNTQQRIAAARTQLRRHLEQQLLQLPPPKAPVPDLSFIPNATQPDFLYLLGLDLVVQRNLKDKTVFKKVDFDPYQCEECGTDFTPNWKAISGDKEDLHLYCEQCVRQAQKRKVRHERTILYKKAFQKIAEQEKEFERQVNAGKFNDTPATSTAKDSSNASTHNSNLSSKASNFNAAALSGLSHSANSLANAANRGVQNSFNSLNKPKQEPPKKQQQPLPPASRKRPNPTSNSSSSTSSNMNSTFASLASNPNALRLLQQMSNMTGGMGNVNPMMASLMSNPQMMTQFYNQMLNNQQQQQETQRQQQRAANSSNTNNNAVSAILQAIAQSQGARNSASSSNHNSSSSHHQSSNHQNHSSHNSHSNHQSSSSNSNSNILSQMTPALLQQLVAAAQQRKK